MDGPAGKVDPEIMEDANYQTTIYQIDKIRFDHTGTEAAAISEVVNTMMSAVIEEAPPFEFICDRPFAYAIEDTLNGDIAFIGAVTKL